MFMGSGHVKPGEFDDWLEARRRRQQRLDRERPHQLLDQRAVERARARAVPRIGSHGLSARLDDAEDRRRAARRRQERAAPELREPAVRHGRSSTLGEMLYPEGHPYHWPVIGYMPDLTAASYDDVVAFFKKYYAPSNASLVVAGDLDPATARTLVEKWFGDVKPRRRVEPMTIPGVALTGVQKKTITDRVQLPRLYLAWLTPRALRARRRGARHRGRRARRRQELAALQAARLRHADRAGRVSAFQASQALSSYFLIDATPRPGPHGRRAAEGDRRGDREAAARAADGARGRARRSTRSKRRSTTGWSASAASAARPIS